jgi:PadR family transcriptional regulator, regulatory protein PadR
VQDERELLRGNTPTMVLAILKTGPQHGYGIAREINRRTGNSLKFKQGTLYPVLHSLEEAGFVSGVWETVDGERPRRVYTISEAGDAELERRTQVWNQFVTAMGQVIGGETSSEQPA